MATDTMPVQLDGTPKIEIEGRSPTKLATRPQIAIAVPCGDKRLPSLLTCEKDQGGCGATWMAESKKLHDLVPIRWALSFLNLQQPLNTGYILLVEGGRLSAEARQIMTQAAIRRQAKYILYWDDDVLVPQQALAILHNWMERHPEAGAISAVYPTRVPGLVEPLVYTEHGAGAAWGIPMGPGAEPVPILGAGAGFLLARIAAIEDVMAKIGPDQPIWADEVNVRDPGTPGPAHHSKVFWGHDVRFCKLLAEHGWSVYAHGGVLCGHYDIESGVTYEVPADAPGFNKKANINTAAYWDQVYGKEGANTWRTYPQMFEKVLEFVSYDPSESVDKVAELGCGVGVLGSMLTARGKVSQYKGYDISPAAVEMAKTRFLDAEVLDVRNLTPQHLDCAETVIATELLEHLDEEVFHHVLDVIGKSLGVWTFVFTVPDNCMGPEDVPEHTALFNEDLVRQRLSRHSARWGHVRIEKAGDDAHLVCVLTR